MPPCVVNYGVADNLVVAAVIVQIDSGKNVTDDLIPGNFTVLGEQHAGIVCCD